MKKYKLLCSIILLILPLQAYAADSAFEQEKKAIKLLYKKDYKAAFSIFSELTKDNKLNINAYYHIGLMYQKGMGVNKDYKKAALNYEKAASKGHPLAQLNWSILALAGKIKIASPDKIIRNLEESSSKDNANSLFLLGMLHAKGQIVKKNDKKAFHYNKRSAEKGFGPAMLVLARAYNTGTGVDVNNAKAMIWASLAMVRKQPGAKRLYQHTKKQLNETEIEFAKKEAKSYYDKYITPYSIKAPK